MKKITARRLRLAVIFHRHYHDGLLRPLAATFVKIFPSRHAP
jgi:hypothetical protein